MAFAKSFNYSDSAIIRPPEDVASSDFRYYFLVVDSRDRNRSVYPNPSQYVIDVPCDVSNIKTATLISAFVPNVDLNVTGNENALVLRTEPEAAATTLEVRAGKYDGPALADALNLAAAGTITASFDPIANRFAFAASSSSSVRLDFTVSNSIARQLGFARTVYALEAGGATLIAPFVADLGANSPYAFLTIGDFGTIHGVGNAASSSFALLSCSNDQQVVSSEMFTKYFNPTLARLSQLRVKLVDYYGNLADFQNRDHYFILKFGCLKSNIRF